MTVSINILFKTLWFRFPSRAMAGWEEGCISLQEVADTFYCTWLITTTIHVFFSFPFHFLTYSAFDWGKPHFQSRLEFVRNLILWILATVSQKLISTISWKANCHQIYEDCPAFLQPCLYKADYHRSQYICDVISWSIGVLSSVLWWFFGLNTSRMLQIWPKKIG